MVGWREFVRFKPSELCEVFDVVSVESVGNYSSYEENGPTKQLPSNTRVTTDQDYTQLCREDGSKGVFMA